MIDTGQPLIQQSSDPGEWAVLFWINSLRVAQDKNGNPIFYDWCVNQYGEPDNTFSIDFGNASWSIIQGMQTTYVLFKDPNEAMMFKLTWYHDSIGNPNQ